MADQETSHEEVQWNLPEMGASLGLDVWVARNDRNKSFGGHVFLDAPHTTAVNSGLLRMSDLVTLHPDLMIRLYIVAPDARKAKVMNELVRPTFDALEPPLRTACGSVPHSRLFAEAETVRRYGDQLKPGFLSGIAEYAPDLDEGYRSA